jgi:hypothetical protein
MMRIRRNSILHLPLAHPLLALVMLYLSQRFLALALCSLQCHQCLLGNSLTVFLCWGECLPLRQVASNTECPLQHHAATITFFSFMFASTMLRSRPSYARAPR